MNLSFAASPTGLFARLGIASKIGTGVAALMTLSIFICVAVLVFVIETEQRVTSLSNEELPRIILFAELERSLENILFTAEELSRADNERRHRNLSEEILAQQNLIANILADPVLRTQKPELDALSQAITTSLQSLSDTVLHKIGLEQRLGRHFQGMRNLRRLSIDGDIPAEIADLVNDLEDAAALTDRYQLRVQEQLIRERYKNLLEGPPIPLPQRASELEPDWGSFLALNPQVGGRVFEPNLGRPVPPADRRRRQAQDIPPGFGPETLTQAGPPTRLVRPLNTSGGIPGANRRRPGAADGGPPVGSGGIAVLMSQRGGVIAIYDDVLRTTALIRGLRSEVESIVSDFAFVAQARFSALRQLAAANAEQLEAVTGRINTLLQAGIALSLVFAALVWRFLRRNVSSRLTELRKGILAEAARIAGQNEAGPAQPKSGGGDEIAAISGSVDIFLSEIGQVNSRLRSNLEKIEQDVDLARMMQEAIVPRSFPHHPAFKIGASMTPARQVGGDFYEFFSLDEDRIGIAIADVSGKGVSAAFFMAISLTVLETAALQHRSPASVLKTVNDRLNTQNPLFHFVTMFYGVLDLRTGQFRFANGGHNPPLVLRANGEVETLPITGDPMLAVFPDQVFKEASVDFNEGDSVVLFTDGVTETFNRENEEFGEARLLNAVRHHAGKEPCDLIEGIEGQVRDFSGSREQSDDLTCLVLRYDGPGVSGTETLASIDLEIANDISLLPGVHERLNAFYRQHGIEANIQFQTNLCIEEYIVNLINYAYQDDDRHVIRITARKTDVGLQVDLVDDGTPFDPLSAPEADLDTPLESRPMGGLGVHLIKSYMDQLSYQSTDTGNHFTMVKALNAA